MESKKEYLTSLDDIKSYIKSSERETLSLLKNNKEYLPGYSKLIKGDTKKILKKIDSLKKALKK